MKDSRRVFQRFFRFFALFFLLPLCFASCDFFDTDEDESTAVTEITIQVNGWGRAD